MENPVLVALIAAVSGLGTVAAALWANKRLGLGQPIEEKINSRLKVLNDALEDEAELRKQDADECKAMLERALVELAEERRERSEREDELNQRLDDLEATKYRLLKRLGMTLEQDEVSEVKRMARDAEAGE